MYAEPPYEEGPEQFGQFREMLLDQLERAGFALVTAHDREQLVGAVYGWTMIAGTWWSQAEDEPPSTIKNTDKFAVMEWLVHPAYRKHGIGGNLMDRLLGSRHERYATLASDPRSAARQIYKRAGWLQVGRSKLPWGPKMDLLALELNQRGPRDA